MAPFSWSLSRHTTFATCRRRYYYAYYAAQDDAEVRRLKGLSALPLWAGSVVHEAIERYLKSADGPPSSETQAAVIRQAVHGQMAGEFRESEAGSPRFRLFEHEYAVPVEQEDKRIAVETVVRCLRHFFCTTTLADALAVGSGGWLTIEDLASFNVEDVELLLRMDLAFRRRDGRLVIVDWKTGRSEGRFNEVQVACYALYAVERGWARSAEEIETQLIYLSFPRTASRRVTAAALERVRGFVRRSAQDMRALLADVAANAAREEDFPRIDAPRTCRRCNFRRLCFPRFGEDGPGAGAGARLGTE